MKSSPAFKYYTIFFVFFLNASLSIADDFAIDIRLGTVVCSKSSFCRIGVSNGLVITGHELFGEALA